MGIANSSQNHKTADLTELVGTQLFKQVSMAQVSALLRFCPTLALANGERLIVPGQTIDKIHLLLQGRLQVFDGEPGEKPVGEIRQGECVGLSSFVDRQPCHVSIVSEGISRLLVLDEERMTALINTPTTVSRNLLFLLMTYLRNKAARQTEPAPAPAEPAKAHNHIDPVTGLHNQGWLDETLDRLILRAATDSAPLSLLAVDLFDLPGLTAQYEQELLNLSLHEIAKTLSASIRPTDLIARHATGRFIIMLPGADQENSDLVAARIQEIVNSTEVVIPGVCALPPMKIVMGGVRLRAFVSSRKLVDDAFASLELNRAAQLAGMAELAATVVAQAEAAAAVIAAEAAMAEAEAEATAAAAAAYTPEPETTVADLDDSPEVVPQPMETIAEQPVAAAEDTLAEMVAEPQTEDTLTDSITLDSVSEIHSEHAHPGSADER